MRKLLLSLPMAFLGCSDIDDFPKGKITRIEANDPMRSAYFYIDRRDRKGDYAQCDLEFTDAGQNGSMDYYGAVCGSSKVEKRGDVEEAPEEIKRIAKSIEADYFRQESRKP